MKDGSLALFNRYGGYYWLLLTQKSSRLSLLAEKQSGRAHVTLSERINTEQPTIQVNTLSNTKQVTKESASPQKIIQTNSKNLRIDIEENLI